MARGDQPVNQLDAACKEHDIAYSQNQDDMSARHTADKILAEKAWQRVLAKDPKLGEKAMAFAVTNAMKLKTKLGSGLKINSKSKVSKRKPKKLTTFNSIVKKVSKSVGPSNTPKSIITAALKASRFAVKEAGGKSKIKVPRILPVSSKIGGFLPLVPAGVSGH